MSQTQTLTTFLPVHKMLKMTFVFFWSNLPHENRFKMVIWEWRIIWQNYFLLMGWSVRFFFPQKKILLKFFIPPAPIPRYPQTNWKIGRCKTHFYTIISLHHTDSQIVAPFQPTTAIFWYILTSPQNGHFFSSCTSVIICLLRCSEFEDDFNAA